MDIKDLNKPQLILLAVLLSFIVSLATGITTVTLMQQAPASVITPINRVVQQTVEKIQQVEGKTIVQTVVVKEEDLVVDAIFKNKSATFSIYKITQNEDLSPAETSVGRGFAISNDGVVAADAMLVGDKANYYVKNDSGKFKADFISVDKAGFSFLKIGVPLNGTDKLSFTVPAFGDLEKMKRGQQILVVGSTVVTSIFEGLNENKSLDLAVSKGNAGALVLNLDGEALGIALSGESSSFAPINIIKNALLPGATAAAAVIVAPPTANTPFNPATTQ